MSTPNPRRFNMTLRALLVIALVVVFASPVAAQQYFQASLAGTNEVPANASPAVGLGCFTLNPNNTLDYHVTFVGLTGAETGAHIHGPALANQNAGIQFPFPAAGSPKIGTFGPLSAQQVADLQAGLYYVNIHSTNYLGGEIRGQILTGSPCTVPTEDATWSAIKALYQ
jgi:hypothetical protein